MKRVTQNTPSAPEGAFSVRGGNTYSATGTGTTFDLGSTYLADVVGTELCCMQIVASNNGNMTPLPSGWSVFSAGNSGSIAHYVIYKYITKTDTTAVPITFDRSCDYSITTHYVNGVLGITTGEASFGYGSVFTPPSRRQIQYDGSIVLFFQGSSGANGWIYNSMTNSNWRSSSASQASLTTNYCYWSYAATAGNVMYPTQIKTDDGTARDYRTYVIVLIPNCNTIGNWYIKPYPDNAAKYRIPIRRIPGSSGPLRKPMGLRMRNNNNETGLIIAERWGNRFGEEGPLLFRKGTEYHNVHLDVAWMCNFDIYVTWGLPPSFTLNDATLGLVDRGANYTKYPGFTSTTGDPRLHMPDIGSFDPNKMRYFEITYRVQSGTAGDFQIYYYTDTENYATENQVVFQTADSTPISPGNNTWNVAVIDMWQSANWKTRGNIRGFRFDMGSNSGFTMEVYMLRLIGG